MKLTSFSAGDVFYQEYTFVELFAGYANVTKAMKMAGHTGLAIDRDFHAAFDFLEDGGFLLAVIAVLKLVPGGILIAAPVCSSFCAMCRAQTKRTARNPLGDDYMVFVKDGNTIANRLILILWLACSLDVLFLVEQPGGSTMWSIPRFRFFQESSCRMIKVCFWMKEHGSRTAKRTALYANSLQAKLLSTAACSKDNVGFATCGHGFFSKRHLCMSYSCVYLQHMLCLGLVLHGVLQYM